MKPIHTAQIKAMPQDFVVHERLADDFVFSHDGEHLWLLIQKQGVNTAHLVKLLAQWAGVPTHDVGYSGLKDRHARTQQWCSIRLPKMDLPALNLPQFDTHFAKLLPQSEHINLIQHARHRQKLMRGTHKTNHFVITLRQVVADKTALDEQLQQIRHTGVPNFFGKQRFGHDNVAQAQEFFADIVHKKPPKRLNAHAERMVSVARADLFNQILDARVADGSWANGLDGDVFNLNRTNSLFCDELNDTLKQRLASGDVHPTGAMFGVGGKQPSGTALALETHIAKQNPLFINGLTHLGIKASRRALRMLVSDLAWQWTDDDTLVLDFVLPTGGFATSVLHDLVDDLQDKSQVQK